jgi:S-formylglutathione hydrolase FrmB
MFLTALFFSTLTLAAQEFEVSEGTFRSPTLKRDIPFWAMIPKTDTLKKIPVVYFLHGRGGSHKMFSELGGEAVWKNSFQRSTHPMAIIALSAKYDDRDTYWVNEARGVRWADMILQEMIPWLEKKFSVGGTNDLRMVSGISMGSHGAFQLGINSNGMFRCAAGHSIVVRNFETASAQFPIAFGDRQEFAQRDPLTLLQRYADYRQVPLKKVWIDIGKQDDAHFRAQARLFGRELRRLGFSSPQGSHIEVEQRDGRHDYPYWQQRMAEYILWYQNCFSSRR